MSIESEPGMSRRAVMRGAVLLGVGAGVGVPMLAGTPAAAQVTSPTIYGRSAWGARPPRGTINIIGNRPNKIVIHHTATANQSNTSQSAAFALSRAIQSFHMDSNGWTDTGQQFTISRGGYIMEGRSQSLPTLRGGTSFPQGAHVSGQNTQSIGIENEGTYTSVGPPAALWSSLVRQCAYICSQYAIPASRIYGHRDFNATACPGNVLYNRLPQLRSEVAALLDGAGGGDYSTIIDNTSSRFSASGDWGTSSYSADRYGADYRFADPVLASDAAWYRFNLPSSGTYRVDAWWPANAGYNDSTPYVIVTSSGSQTVHVSQRGNGGRWVNLGSFALAAGDRNVVGVSRWTTGTGYVIADAVRIRN